MDLGIAGRHAIVAASSAGLGFACAQSLAGEGVHVVINGRDPQRLDDAATNLRAESTVTVETVAGDIADPATRAALLAVCAEPDILVTNNGGPPPGQFQQWGRDEWIAAVDANMLAPLLLIRDVIDGMVERRFGRIVNITSAMVTTPHAAMGLSSAARTGLTSATKGLSREVASANVTINNLLPERIDTGRQRQMAELAGRDQGHHDRRGLRGDRGHDRGGPPRPARRSRRRLRVPVQRAGRVHLGPEPAPRRRLVPGPVLMEHLDVDVLIVGAGPVGLTAALLLERLGCSVAIVERRDGPQRAPAAHAVNARTFEIWRQIGLDVDHIRSHAQDPADAGAVHWVTKLGGEVIASLPYERQGDEQLAVTPTPLRNLSQHHLEPLLVDALGKAGIDVRYDHRWESATTDDAGRALDDHRAGRHARASRAGGCSRATARRARCGACSASSPTARTASRAS